MFIHFGMSTFVGDQFGRIPSPSTAFAPTDLDEEQWARTAKEAGMKYMVLTVKHHYGHALWPSAYSDYTVATSSYKFDVTKRFVAACRKHDLKPGFYYSLGWDSRHMKKMKPEEYEQFVHNQIKELLTNYGPITMLWFDIPWDMGPDMSGSLARLYAHCKSLQPDCLILLNQGFVDGSFVEKGVLRISARMFRKRRCRFGRRISATASASRRPLRATIRESFTRGSNTTSPTKLTIASANSDGFGGWETAFVRRGKCTSYTSRASAADPTFF